MIKKSISVFTLFTIISITLFAQASFNKDVPWYSFYDLNSTSFYEKLEKYKNDYIMTDLDVYRTLSGVTYSMILEKNTGNKSWVVYRELSGDEYNTINEDFKSRGYRAMRVEGIMYGNTVKYAGIWIKNDENYQWVVKNELTKTAYETFVAEQRQLGRRLVDVDIYKTSNGLRYSSIWIENREQIVWSEVHNISLLVCKINMLSLKSNGYLITNFKAYEDENGNQFYAFIAEKRPGFECQVFTELTELEYANLSREYNDKGFKAIDFECRSAAFARKRYCAVWIENNRRYHDPRKNALDSLIQKYKDSVNVPGITVAIIKDGDMIYRRGFGFADKNAGKIAHGETIYFLASVSKIFAGTLAVKLQDEGKLRDGTAVSLNLNNATSAYLTNVQKSDGTTVSIPAKHTHTVAQLFAHLACVHESENRPQPVIRQYAKEIDALSQIWNTELIEGCVMGTDKNYSNPGYAFITAILENVTNKTAPQLIRSEFAVPYNLETLRALNESETIPYNYDRAVPYIISTASLGNVPTEYGNKSWKVFAGGMEISAVDLASFGWKLLNGEIVNPGARDRILWTSVNPDKHTGIAWDLSRTSNPVRMAYKDGRYDGSRSYIRIYRDQGLVIAILSNRGNGEVDDPYISPLTDKIADIIFR